ncbi:MAG: hypothetical protein RLZZ419_1464 [Pseudomonadota bacterium]|jgi:hypothetical protein
MSYARYKRILLLKRVEVTSARMQKVPSHGTRKVEARLEQRSRIIQERRSNVQRSIKSTIDSPIGRTEEGAFTGVDIDTIREG